MERFSLAAAKVRPISRGALRDRSFHLFPWPRSTAWKRAAKLAVASAQGLFGIDAQVPRQVDDGEQHVANSSNIAADAREPDSGRPAHTAHRNPRSCTAWRQASRIQRPPRACQALGPFEAPAASVARRQGALSARRFLVGLLAFQSGVLILATSRTSRRRKHADAARPAWSLMAFATSAN